MTNLLSAHLFRLRKNRLFWLCLLLSAAAGAWQPIQTSLEYGRQQSVDMIFFVYTMLIGLLLSVFLPLFFGAEYSDGAVRNKLAAGHTRLSVYLANLTVSAFAASLFCGVYVLLTTAVGVPLLGAPKAPAQVLITLLFSLLTAAAWCAVDALVIQNCSRKAVSAVSCMLLYLGLFLFAAWVFGRLEAAEFYPGYSLTAEGQMTTEMIPNPSYLTPDQRPLYEFLLDLNPVGQAMQYINVAVARPVQLALCSLGAVAVTTIAGAALFRRKDLK